MGSAQPPFATRLAGHDPEPTGLVPVARAALPDLVVIPGPAEARHALRSPPRPFAEQSSDDLLSMPVRRLPVLPVRAMPVQAAYASEPGLRERLVTLWRDWLRFSAWRGMPRDVDWVGWRDRAEPTLFVSFALIGSAAVLIGLYSFSNGGMYNPITSVPSQTNGPPPEAAPDAVPPGIRAIHPPPGANASTPASSGSSVPQASASRPAPGARTSGSSLAGQSTLPGPGSGSVVPTQTHPPGGGSTPTATPTVTATSTPTVTETATPTPSDTASSTPTPTPSPTPSDTATTTAPPGP